MKPSEILCQSCGMPIRSSGDYGSDSVGARRFEYCYRCYSGGKFVDGSFSIEARMEKSIEMAVKRGVHESEARKKFEKIIPRLARWNKPDYRIPR